jgi:hypothetical protein
MVNTKKRAEMQYHKNNFKPSPNRQHKLLCLIRSMGSIQLLSLKPLFFLISLQQQGQYPQQQQNPYVSYILTRHKYQKEGASDGEAKKSLAILLDMCWGMSKLSSYSSLRWLPPVSASKGTSFWLPSFSAWSGGDSVRLPTCSTSSEGTPLAGEPSSSSLTVFLEVITSLAKHWYEVRRCRKWQLVADFCTYVG